MAKATESFGRVAIIAALERELAPLVRGWQTRDCNYERRRYRFYESPQAIAVAGGIGKSAARSAAKASLELYSPKLLISYGVAGSCSSLEIATPLITSHVIDQASGEIFGDPSAPALLTATTVLNPEEKLRLAKKFNALAVDMEAFAVAQAAADAGVPFIAIKAISDSPEHALPPLAPFIQPDGSFRTTSFVLHVAARPWLWLSVVLLASNTSKAIAALAPALRNFIDNQQFAATAIKSTEQIKSSF